MTNEQVAALIESLRGGMTSNQADELTEQVVAVPEDRQDDFPNGCHCPVALNKVSARGSVPLRHRLDYPSARRNI